MTDVTVSHDQDGTELSAADEQLLRELTERARTGGLRLTGEGGLLGKLTKMVVGGALEGELAELEDAWREAEEIAAISDVDLTPPKLYE